MNKINPFPWQQPSANRLAEILRQSDFAALTAGTGLGKTVISLEAMRQLQQPYFVMCPKQVISAWKDTIERMDVHEPLHLFNPEKLLYRNPVFQKPNKWLPDPGTICIFDECHKTVTGIKSKTALVMAWAKKHGIKMVASTATLGDSPLKLRLMLYYADICGWELSKFYAFARSKGCFASPTHNGLEFTKGPRGKRYMEEIGVLFADKRITLTPEDAPGFPSVLIQTKLFDADETYRKRIEHMAFPEEWSDVNDNELVEMLRQRQRCEAIKVPIIADLVRETISEEHVPVVFVSFRFTLSELQKELADLKIGCIYGGQKDRERDEVLRLSREDRLDAIICMIQAGGVGISLHATEGMRLRTSFISPSFSASETTQCLGRLRRANGQHSVQTFLLLNDSVEVRVKAAIDRKLKNLDAFNSIEKLSLEDSDLMGM
jgi:hypothetical protein